MKGEEWVDVCPCFVCTSHMCKSPKRVIPIQQEAVFLIFMQSKALPVTQRNIATIKTPSLVSLSRYIKI